MVTFIQKKNIGNLERSSVFEHNSRSPINSVSIQGYWDGPLSGWIRTRGQYYFFEVIDDKMHYRLFHVYYVEKSIRISYLKRIRAFRSMVGWHQTRYPGKPRTYFLKSFTSALFREFYDVYSPANVLPIIPLTAKKLVGITDIKEEVIWYYDLEDYNKNWQYVEYQDEKE